MNSSPRPWFPKRMPQPVAGGVGLPDPSTVCYRGRRTAGGPEVTRLDGHGHRIPLSLRLDLRSHCPSGFEWGEGHPGSSQLALALLADAIDGDEALRLYRDYERLVVSRLDRARWELSREQIRQWARHQQGLEE